MKKLFTVMTVVGLLFVQGVTVSAIDETEDNSIPWTDIEEGKEIDEGADDSIPWTDIEEGKEIDDSIPWTDIEDATKLYTVGFESRGGEEIADVTVEEGAVIEVPAEPTREGYDFKGWYIDEDWTESYNFTTEVTQDTTLYARWRLSVTPEYYTISATTNVEVKRSEILAIEEEVGTFSTIQEFIDTISERAEVKILLSEEDDFMDESMGILWSFSGDFIDDTAAFQLELEENPLVNTSIAITLIDDVIDALPIVPADPVVPKLPETPAEVDKVVEPKEETLPQTGVATGISLGLVSALSGVVTLIAKKKLRD